jgi:hypothetical protein
METTETGGRPENQNVDAQNAQHAANELKDDSSQGSASNQDNQNQGEQASSTEKTEDQVSYSSFQKLLKEKKKRDQQVREYEQRLKESEMQQLESQGNLQEVNERLRARLQEAERKNEDQQKQIANSILHSQLEQEALRRGCHTPDKLMRLLDPEDYEQLNLDDNYKLDKNSLQLVMDKAQRDNPFLFERKRASVSDTVPNSKPLNPGEPSVDYSKMTTEQIKAHARNLK